MKKILRKAFGVYPSEITNTFRFIRLAIFFSCGSGIAEILTDGLFLEYVGAKYLPISFMITAFIFIGISSLLIYFLRITTAYKIFFKLLLFSAMFYVISSSFMFFFPNYYILLFFIDIFSYIFFASLISTFWNFLDQYHDIQDAKRIYGIYTAAFLLGYMSSGLLIKLLYNYLNPSIFLLISSILTLFSIVEIKNIHKNIPDIEDDLVEGFFSKGKRGIISILRSFYKSPFAIFVILMSLIVQLLRSTTEFNYMQNLENIFKEKSIEIGKESISQFLGKWTAIMSGISIFFGVFFFRRLVKRIRIANVVLIPPFFFLALYSRWLFSSSTIIVIFAIFSLACILDNIEDNNFNILVNTTPSKIRGILRIVNDSFFEPIGMLISSFFLMVTPHFSLIIGLLLSIIFLTAAIFVKYLYPKAILKNLKENAIHFERNFTNWIKSLSKKEQKEIEEDLLKELNNSKSEKSKFLAFKTLLLSNSKKIYSNLLSTADTFSSKIQKDIIKLLGKTTFSNNKKTIILIKKWENSDSEEVRNLSTFYLAKRGMLKIKNIENNLKGENLILKTATIFYLKKLKNKNCFSIKNHLEMAEKQILALLYSENENEIKSALLILKEEKTLSSFNILERVAFLLYHGSLKIEIEASKILKKFANENLFYFANKIIDKIKKTLNSKTRILLLEALFKIGNPNFIKDIILATLFFTQKEKRHTKNMIICMGKKSFNILSEIVEDLKLNYKCRILALEILKRIKPEYLQKNLQKIIDKEIERAYFYFYSYNLIKKEYYFHYDLRLLKNALFTSFKSVINFIIHIISASKSLEDTELLIHSLNSKNEKNHANALETLEQNCPSSIFCQILPLIDDLPWESKLDAYFKKNKKYPSFSLNKLLEKLENSPFVFDNIIAFHFKAKLKITDWKKSLKKQLEKNKNVIFKNYGLDLLNFKTSSLIEREKTKTVS